MVSPAETLAARYPRLWHMADPRNVGGILSHGLLSTSALLDLFEYYGERREAIESAHRPQTIAIKHKRHGVAYVRDQKPMSVKKLNGKIADATVTEFLTFLNGQVFFWLTTDRLVTMNTARAYRSIPQLVLEVNTASLICEYEARIRLSPMNSGNTSPFAHERSISMFKSFTEYDWQRRQRSPHPVVELTVPWSVPDIWAHVTAVGLWRGGQRIKRLNRPYDDSLARRTLTALGKS